MVMMTVRPCSASPLSSSTTLRARALSSPLVGSSHSSRAGLVSTALARPNRFLSPPDMPAILQGCHDMDLTVSNPVYLPGTPMRVCCTVSSPRAATASSTANWRSCRVLPPSRTPAFITHCSKTKTEVDTCV